MRLPPVIPWYPNQHMQAGVGGLGVMAMRPPTVMASAPCADVLGRHGMTPLRYNDEYNI